MSNHPEDIRPTASLADPEVRARIAQMTRQARRERAEAVAWLAGAPARAVRRLIAAGRSKADRPAAARLASEF